MRFIQELLNWVEETQVLQVFPLYFVAAFHKYAEYLVVVLFLQLQLDRSEWGSDLPSVEMHLENHKSVHRVIEEFQMSLKDAKLSEVNILESRTLFLKSVQCCYTCSNTTIFSDPDDFTSKTHLFRQTDQTGEAV